MLVPGARGCGAGSVAVLWRVHALRRGPGVLGAQQRSEVERGVGLPSGSHPGRCCWFSQGTVRGKLPETELERPLP